MDEPDEVDYDDSDSDFADLEIDLDDETDVLPQQEAASQPVDTEPGLLCSDREEGEATPRASPLVAAMGASSELEDGEFLMDSEPMQLEETASAHEAASKRQPDFDDSSSEDEEGRRRSKQHRHRRSPEVGPGRVDSNRSKHLDVAHDTYRRSWGRERDRRDERRGSAVPFLQDSRRHPIPNQGFRHGYSDMQSLVRVGSFPAPHLGPPAHMLDPELSRRQPYPHSSRPGVPLRPAFGPPLEIHAGSNLTVQSVRSGQGNSQVLIGYQISAERQQHLHPPPHVLPQAPAARQPPLRPPILSHPTLDLRPPFGGPALHPVGLHPPPNLGAGPGLSLHRVPPDDDGPFRQGGGPFNAPRSRDLVHPHARIKHLHRGHSNSPGGEFSRRSRPPKDLPRSGSGRMESLRAQLEDQGSLVGDPPRVRLDGHRSAVNPPPPPPARRADERAMTSRSPPVDANGKGKVKQRPSFSPERRNVAKRQESEGARADISKGRATGHSEERSPRRDGGRSPGKSRSGGKESGSSGKRERSVGRVQSSGVDKSVVLEKQPSTSDGNRKATGEKEEGLGDGRRGREQGRTSSVWGGSNGEGETNVSGRDSSEPHRSASRSSQEVRASDDASRSIRRKREEDARETEEREKEAREKEMRHRALQILEAGRHKKRKEREEQRRNDLGGEEPGTSGREDHRPGLPGLRRDGRDRKAQRNYRRRSEFDDNDERSSSRSQGRGDSPEQPRRRSADLRERSLQGPLEPNVVERSGRGGRAAAVNGKGSNLVPLGGEMWADRGDGLGDGYTQPHSRRVVVGLGAIDRRPDLPRFSDRDRDFAPSKNAGRESPGPPGFEKRAPAQRPRLGWGPENRLGRLGDPDRAAGLQRSGSGAVVSIGARQPSKTLAVNNLPENFESGHILDIFKKYGPVQLVQQTGKSSVEVTFRREDEAKAARANVHRMIKLEGREVLVEYKAPVPT